MMDKKVSSPIPEAVEILIIEDHLELLDILEKELLRHHFHVRVATDGEIGLSEAQRQPPGLIILDLKLPKISGIEVLQRIRETPETTHLPVVILTSSDEDKDILNSYSLRANSYVKKPVDYDTFMGTVKNLGLYWTETNLQPPGRPSG